MDLHDLETPEWESYTNEGTQNRDEPITTAQNQPITAEHNASPVDEWIVDLFGRKSPFEEPIQKKRRYLHRKRLNLEANNYT